MGGADAGTESIRRTGHCRRDHQGGRCRSAHRALPGRHGDAEPHGAELAECLGATSGEAPRQEARNHCAGPAYRRGASPDVAGWHRVPVHTRRRDGASDSIGAAASHRQSARRKEPRLKVGDPPVSPRRDAVPDDARNRPCLPNRLIAFEHAAQIGTRESFWTRHEVGSRRADHGRKREPGDGHIRDRGSFSRPGRRCNRPTLNRSRDGPGRSRTTLGDNNLLPAPRLRERSVVSRRWSIEN